MIRYIRIDVGHHGDDTADVRKFGAGWRALLLLDPGRLNVTALDPVGLRALRVRRDTYEAAADIGLSPRRWRKMAARLDHQRRGFKRWSIQHDGDLIERAAAQCRARANGG